MADDISKEVEKSVTPAAPAIGSPESAAKPKKKKPAAKPAAAKVIKKKPTPPEAPKPALKSVEKKPESSLVFASDKPARKTSRSSNGGAAKAFGALVIVAAVIGGFGYVWNKTQQAVSESQQTTTDLRAQVDGEVSGLKDRLQQIADELQAQKQKQQEVPYTEYRSEDIGITFRYPKNLGEVQAQAQDTKGKKTISLTFTSNPDLWLVASVGDNDSTNAFVYDGGTKNLASTCKEPLKVTEKGYCDLIAVMGGQTAEKVRPIGEDALLNVVKTIPINIDHNGFKGLTANVGLGLPPVTGRDLFASPDEKELNAALEQFFRNLIKREQLSIVVQENLSAFQTILASLQVVANGS